MPIHKKITENQQKDIIVKVLNKPIEINEDVNKVIVKGADTKQEKVSYNYGNQATCIIKHNEKSTINLKDNIKSIDVYGAELEAQANISLKEVSNNDNAESIINFYKNSISTIKRSFDLTKKHNIYQAIKGLSVKGDNYFNLFGVSKPNCSIDVSKKQTFLTSVNAIKSHIEGVCKVSNLSSTKIVFLLGSSLYSVIENLLNNADDLLLRFDQANNNKIYYSNIVFIRDDFLKENEYLAYPLDNFIFYVKFSFLNMRGIYQTLEIKEHVSEFEEEAKIKVKEKYEYINTAPDAVCNNLVNLDKPQTITAND